jgi:hypothetical protein
MLKIPPHSAALFFLVDMDHSELFQNMVISIATFLMCFNRFVEVYAPQSFSRRSFLSCLFCPQTNA